MKNTENVRVDMSSTAFLKDNWKEQLFACRQYCEKIN